jgi:hypothetical protein
MKLIESDDGIGTSDTTNQRGLNLVSVLQNRLVPSTTLCPKWGPYLLVGAISEHFLLRMFAACRPGMQVRVCMSLARLNF